MATKTKPTVIIPLQLSSINIESSRGFIKCAHFVELISADEAIKNIVAAELL